VDHQPEPDSGSDSLSAADPVKARTSPTAGLIDRAALERTAIGVLKVISSIVQTVLARTQDERDTRLWHIEDQEARDIAKPTLSIVDRHGLSVTGDTADGLSVLAAVAAYIQGRISRRVQLRRDRSAAAAYDNQEGPVTA
jgi:hypothetical protein